MYQFFTSIFGSQNQNLATEKSDKDYISVYVPAYPMLIGKSEYISNTYHELGGDTKIVDSRIFFQQLKKPTFNNMEILCSTDIKVFDDNKYFFDALVFEREAIAHSDEKNFINSIGGVTQKIVKQYKDSKDVSRLPYFREMLEKFLDGCLLVDCFRSSQRNYILDIRNGEYDLEHIVKFEYPRIEKLLNSSKQTGRTVNRDIHVYIDDINYKLMTKYVLHFLKTKGDLK